MYILSTEALLFDFTIWFLEVYKHRKWKTALKRVAIMKIFFLTCSFCSWIRYHCGKSLKNRTWQSRCCVCNYFSFTIIAFWIEILALHTFIAYDNLHWKLSPGIYICEGFFITYLRNNVENCFLYIVSALFHLPRNQIAMHYKAYFSRIYRHLLRLKSDVL